MKKGRIGLLLLSLLLAAVAQNCAAPSPATDQIDTGKVSLQMRRGSSRQHCFSVNINYMMPSTGRSPDIAVAVSRIAGFNTGSGFDFSVSAARKGLTNTIGITVLIDDDNRWTSLEVSYLVSSNTNFIVGSFIGNLVAQSSCVGNSGSVALETYVPTYRLNANVNYKVVSYLSGFRTSDRNFDLRPTATAIDKLDGRVSFQIQSTASPGQEYVFITYIVYPEGLLNALNFNLASQNSPATYRLEGLIGVSQNSGLEYNQLTICKQADCPPNQVLINGRCDCGQGYIKVDDVCRQPCTQNGYINDQRQCVCMPGFQVTSAGRCMPINSCTGNEILQPDGSCDCRPGFRRNPQGNCIPGNAQQCNGNNEVLLPNGVCGCKQGYYRSNQNTCLSFCAAQNEVWNGRFCDCAPGFVRVFPSMQCVNQQQQSCQVNEVFNPSSRTCECVNGFIRVGPACVNRCGVNSEWRNDRCMCLQGFGLINSVCKQCPAGSQPNSDQICVCQGNSILVNGNVCLPCPINSSPRNNECACNPGLQWNADRTVCVSAQQQCPANGYLGPNGRCVCNTGFQLSPDGRTCNSLCPQNSRWDPQRGCTCVDGYEWSNMSGGCAPKANTCPIGFRKNPQGTNCIPCPSDSTPVQGTCFCNNGFQWSANGLTCQRVGGPSCPQNSLPGPQGCVCNSGFQWTSDRSTCVPSNINCPPNAFIGPQGNCVCNTGLYLENNSCKPIPICPVNSLWDQSKLQCVCQQPGENLISGVCRPCPANQFWNSKQCTCNAGLFRIAGVCRTCDQYTTYNGSDCICNLGYYGTRDRCSKCHETCGQCSGPQSNKCITCADITFSLSNGYCSKNTPCPIGNYLNGSSCAKCSDYCQYCVSELECGECSQGFKIKLIIDDQGLGYSVCEPDCGDGRKVDVEKCDDGNLVNGDGCSSTCTIEPGWACGGGTSVKPSICSKSIPTDSRIEVKGAVNMIDKVVQGVRLSYIPKCFTDNDCQECFKIITVKVIQSAVPIITTVSFVPNSDGQFIIEYRFGGTITSTYFRYQIEINKTLPPQLGSCFSAKDYAQQIVGPIDTATLARNDQTDTLSLNDLTNPANPANPNVPTNSVTTGSVLGYSKKVMDLLFK